MGRMQIVWMLFALLAPGLAAAQAALLAKG